MTLMWPRPVGIGATEGARTLIKLRWNWTTNNGFFVPGARVVDLGCAPGRLVCDRWPVVRCGTPWARKKGKRIGTVLG